MKNLEHIKTGDTVVLNTGGFRGRRVPMKVERVTKTLIVLEGGGKYRRKDGYPPGEQIGYHPSSIEEMTPALREEMREQSRQLRATKALREMLNHGEGFSDEVLCGILGVYETFKGEQNA